jgi:hypothetical protein
MGARNGDEVTHAVVKMRVRFHLGQRPVCCEARVRDTSRDAGKALRRPVRQSPPVQLGHFPCRFRSNHSSAIEDLDSRRAVTVVLEPPQTVDERGCRVRFAAESYNAHILFTL